MRTWANRFSICCFLDNHNYKLPYHSLECVVAVGAEATFSNSNGFFPDLSAFLQAHDDWIFGHFNYDCKNYVEALSSSLHDGIGFPDAFLFVPTVVVELKGNSLNIGTLGISADEVFRQIITEKDVPASFKPVTLLPRIQQQEYISIVKKLQQHLHRGDCYEINFCQEFFQQALEIDFVEVYKKLSIQSPNPFAAYYKLNDKYLACASPERYLKKDGTLLISQPIKGTAPRDTLNPAKDEANKLALQQSLKEQSENVMIVDLVRNDLSKVCAEGSVHVASLMEVQTFPNVHQLVSTVAGSLPGNIGLDHVLRATFPMGSMTGAPKKRVMELIEQYEQTRRGIFSGTVGYITPHKDYDFNVVIRSIMYNQSNRYVSYQVGGAITFLSDPQEEYAECILKAQAMQRVLSGA